MHPLRTLPLLLPPGMALIAIRIATARSNRWLCDANAALCAAVLLACAASDRAGWIAWWNVAHRDTLAAEAPLDLDYLGTLGPAALPALRHLANQEPSPAVQQVINRLEARRAARMRDWRSWSWRAWQTRPR